MESISNPFYIYTVKVRERVPLCTPLGQSQLRFSYKDSFDWLRVLLVKSRRTLFIFDVRKLVFQRIPYCPKCNSPSSRAAEDRPALAPPANHSNPPSALTESPLSSKSDPHPSVHSSQSGPSSGPVENLTQGDPTPLPSQV